MKHELASRRNRPKSDNVGQKWNESHLKMHSQTRVPFSKTLVPARMRTKNYWYRSLVCRTQRVLGSAMFNTPHREFYELSQSMGRSNKRVEEGSDTVCSILHPGSEVWTTHYERLLIGLEHCAFMLWPIETVPGWEELALAHSNTLKDLVGNMFCPASFVPAQLSLWSVLPAISPLGVQQMLAEHETPSKPGLATSCTTDAPANLSDLQHAVRLCEELCHSSTSDVDAESESDNFVIVL